MNLGVLFTWTRYSWNKLAWCIKFVIIYAISTTEKGHFSGVFCWLGLTGNFKMCRDSAFVHVCHVQSEDRAMVDWISWCHHQRTLLKLWGGAGNGSCLGHWNGLLRPWWQSIIPAIDANISTTLGKVLRSTWQPSTSLVYGTILIVVTISLRHCLSLSGFISTTR